jgi:hypothetical protein
MAIEAGEEAGGESGQAARVIAARGRLDLDHVGAEIGHQ